MGATELIWVTPDAEKVISYCARVSSPNNQDNYDTAPKLLKYCIKNNHWSIFEMASMCVGITTSRAIAQQILRHRSFSFQEFSQRYSEVTNYINYDARRQDSKNRQNSLDDLSEETKVWFKKLQEEVWTKSLSYYRQALDHGIAKESARLILPLNTESRLFMSGTVRSWIHYLNLRTGNGSQLEHSLIANEIMDSIFKKNFPSISEAMGWL
jgi:thymidylate synthase (FAD)